MNLIRLRLSNIFGEGRAGRDVAVLTLGTVIAQAIVILATPLLSRIYTPADFGELAVFLAISTVAATLITMRYETAILAVRRNDEAIALVWLALLLASISVALLVGGSFFLPNGIVKLLDGKSTSSFFSLIFTVAGVTAFISVMQNWLNRQKNYFNLARLRVFQSFGVVGIALLLGLLTTDLSGLLWAQALAGIFTVFFYFRCARPVLTPLRPGRILRVARAQINAPKYLLPAAILDVVAMQMPVLLISIWFGEGHAGQFSMAWRMLMLPMSVVGTAIGQVFMQRLSLAHLGAMQARRLLVRTWMLLLALGAVPILMLFFFGQPVFTFFFGKAWSEAGLMAATLSPLALAMFLSSPTSGSFIVLGIQRYSLWFGVAAFIYRPLCIFLGFSYGDVLLGLMLWAICEVAQVAIYQLIAWKKMKQLGENDSRGKKL